MKSLWLSLILIFMLPSVVSGVPVFLTHQGHVVDSDSAPMTGVAETTFKLYSQPVGGSAIWTQQMSVTFDNGFYSVVLGPGSPELSTDIFDGSTLYLGITLDGIEEFVPRNQITTVPYAIRAEIADTAELAERANSLSEDLSSLTLPRGPVSDLPTAENSNQGQIYFATDDGNVYYSNGSEWINLTQSGGSGTGDINMPSIVSVSPEQIEPGEDVTVTLSGSGFEDECEVYFDDIVSESVSFANENEVAAGTGTELVSGAYKVIMMNPNGLRGHLIDGLIVDSVPVWETEEGSLGMVVDSVDTDHYTLVANDLEEQTLTYTLTSGSLPTGLLLNSETGVISGDPDDVNEDQEFTFGITVTDTAVTPNEVERSFSITVIDAIGIVAEAPGNTCKHILEMGSSQGDQVYWIDPNGGDHSDSYQVFCDMTTSGGGWTMFFRYSCVGSCNTVPSKSDWQAAFLKASNAGIDDFLIKSWIDPSHNSEGGQAWTNAYFCDLKSEHTGDAFDDELGLYDYTSNSHRYAHPFCTNSSAFLQEPHSSVATSEHSSYLYGQFWGPASGHSAGSIWGPYSGTSKHIFKLSTNSYGGLQIGNGSSNNQGGTFELFYRE